MTSRMLLAVASLVNALVACYLHLWKLGLVGSLACTSSGGCEYVQGSRYGWFLGTDVALIGAVGWAIVFAVAFVGTLPRWAEDARITRVLTALVGFAVLFTLRLKYGEFVVLRSFCPWCAVNAIVVVLASVLVWRDWVRLRAAQGRAYAFTRDARSTTA